MMEKAMEVKEKRMEMKENHGSVWRWRAIMEA